MRFLAIGEAMVEFSRQPDGLWRQGFAGDTLNVAWAVRALTTGSVDYLTRVGTDALSDGLMAMMGAAGIGVGAVGRDGSRTLGLYTITTDPTGERSFAYWRSNSAARGLADDPGALAGQVAGADWIYVSGITLAILPDAGRAALMDVLRRRTGKLAFDPNFRARLWPDIATARQAIAAMAAQADIVLPSFDDEVACFGDRAPADSAARYAASGPDEVVVKDGPRPTLLRAGGVTVHPVTPADRVIDTTGAGDAFNGGYLAARMAGHAPDRAVVWGQAVSRAVVGVRGALAPMDDLRAAIPAG